MNKCPWCKGPIGDKYIKLREDAVKITPAERKMAKQDEHRPLSFNQKILLIQTSQGHRIYDGGGHPYVSGGSVCSNRDILALWIRKYIQVSFQHFDEKEIGRVWRITEKGKGAVKEIIKGE